MDALTFLYWALGFGFIALVIFSCVALVHLIRILRSAAEVSEMVKDTAESINDNVTRIGDKVADATEQVLEYMIKPVSVAQFVIEKFKPFLDMMKPHSGHGRGDDEEGDEEEEKPRKRRGFRRRKK